MDINERLQKAKKIHFIGIGGAGMCPLAEILLKLGYTVSGSDNNDTETFRRIEREGARCFLGQKKENIAPDTDLVIYTNAILAGNEELDYAKANFPTFERAELLGAFSRHFGNCIGISGTHGKTTTSSMATVAMMYAGLDPSAVIGGKLPEIDAYGRFGHSQNFVCESCEFNNTFLKMTPDIAVILNIDADHLDFFKTLDNIKKAFRQFAESATKAVICNGDDQNTLDAVSGMTGKEMVTFGKGEQNDWRAENITAPDGVHNAFDVFYKGKFMAHVQLSVPGEHNVLNALAAFAAACTSGADPQKTAEGLQEFHGAGRRFEIAGKYAGVTYADDYAHHPKEIEVTLQAAKKMHFKRVWAVHQPFTYSRTKALLDDFARVLQIADKVVLSEIMGSREVNTIGIHTKDLADKIPGAVWFETFDEIADYLLQNVAPGDLVITLGCGDVYKITRIITKRLEEQGIKKDA